MSSDEVERSPERRNWRHKYEPGLEKLNLEQVLWRKDPQVKKLITEN